MSQSPISGNDAHLSPVWFHFLRMRWRNSSPNQLNKSLPGLGFSTEECLLSIGTNGFLENKAQKSSYRMTTANVSHRKYHTWCSSSIKLLDARLTICSNVPTTRMARPWPGWSICVQMYNIRCSRQIICNQTLILRSLRSEMVIFGAHSLDMNRATGYQN